MFKLKLRTGVKGGWYQIKTVPLSFKATVKHIQVVGQSLVISRVGSFRFTVCESFPDRSRVIS